MTFEDFITLIGVIVGLISIITPIMKLTKTMAELNIGVQCLKESLNNITIKNHDAHSRMWEHNKSQDEVINNHEKRMVVVETKLGITPTDGHIETIDERILDD
jgi:hypothetical protein